MPLLISGYAKRLTACVTGGWGEKARKRKTAKVQKQLQKRAESQPSGARFVGRWFRKNALR